MWQNFIGLIQNTKYLGFWVCVLGKIQYVFQLLGLIPNTKNGSSGILKMVLNFPKNLFGSNIKKAHPSSGINNNFLVYNIFQTYIF